VVRDVSREGGRLGFYERHSLQQSLRKRTGLDPASWIAECDATAIALEAALETGDVASPWLVQAHAEHLRLLSDHFRRERAEQRRMRHPMQLRTLDTRRRAALAAADSLATLLHAA
jgi:hypothetical protein